MEAPSEPRSGTRAGAARPQLLDSRGDTQLGPILVLSARLVLGMGLAVGGVTVAAGGFEPVLRLVAWGMAV
ncbi:MAG: hypothetical protein LC749_04575, partial [Actinobacteria bacterium]|nr:hypothetical protein [Actinomycetota bacterium]